MKTIHLLVIGFGNTLRQDDGAGVRVADQIAELRLPGVRVITCHQPGPDLTEPISQASTVVFVDAATSTDGVELHELQPHRRAQAMGHAINPATLLALAWDLHGRQPQAWMLTIPARNLELGEGFSAEIQPHLDEAVQIIHAIHRCPEPVS